MKNLHIFAKAISLAWLFVLTTNITQAAVILLDQARDVRVSADVIAETGSDSAFRNRFSIWNDFADFDETVQVDFTIDGSSASSSASQVSQLSSTSLSGTGMVTVDAVNGDPPFGYATASADTIIIVNFEVTTPQLFDLSGLVSLASSQTVPPGMVDFTLSSQSGSVNFNFSTYENLTIPFNESGILTPDIYSLSGFASAFADGMFALDGTAEFSFDLRLSEVPIPAAFWLFGSGLIGLVEVARRKKAA